MVDDNFWNEVIKSIKPLKNKNIHIDEVKAKEVVIRKDKEISLPFEVLKKGKGVKKDDLSQMDGSLQKRFKREEFEVEATLDLHGMVEKVAFDKVCSFVKSAYNSSKRCVLIITGKGINDELFGERGVLRKSVPLWLSGDEIGSLVLGYRNPSEKLGGKGALYILLRKKG